MSKNAMQQFGNEGNNDDDDDDDDDDETATIQENRGEGLVSQSPNYAPLP